jgi:hypothetical protein
MWFNAYILAFFLIPLNGNPVVNTKGYWGLLKLILAAEEYRLKVESTGQKTM